MVTMDLNAVALSPAAALPGQHSGAEALVAQLALEGVEQVFGAPGVDLASEARRLSRCGLPIRYLAASHEPGAVHMAEGYARTTGRPGVCVVGAGARTAYLGRGGPPGSAGRAPLLCISITDWPVRAEAVTRLPAAVHAALREPRAGRPRPVGLAIPGAVLAARTDVRLVNPEPDHPGFPLPDHAELASLLWALRGAHRPVFYVGWGVQAARATDALVAVAEALGAPVVMSRDGNGAMPPNHPLAYPATAGPKLLGAADLVVVVGSRFLTESGGPVRTAPAATIALVNVDPVDLGPPREAQILVEADARVVLDRLAAALAAGPGDVERRSGGAAAPGWGAGKLAGLRTWVEERIAAAEPQWTYVQALRAAIPDDGILVTEGTAVGDLATVGYPVQRPGTFLTAGYLGTAGYGYPAALGAKIGNPDRAVVSINGGGEFGAFPLELATARRYDIGVTAVVFKEPGGPDAVRLAEAFGVPGVRVDTPDRLGGAIKDAINQSGPVVIEVPPQRWRS